MNVNFGRPGFAGRAAAALPRVCVSAVSGLYPCRLRACGAARSLPCADHAAHQLLRAEGLQRLVQRHTLREWREAWPAKCAGRAVVLETVSVVVPLSSIALRSRPSLLSRSRAAGLDRSLRSLHQLAPAGQRSGINGLRPPAAPDFIPFAGLPRLSLLVAPARNPARALRGAPCAALFEAAPKGRTIEKRRTDMTTKTTNTTNDAGVPPAPPEAHQRAGMYFTTTGGNDD